jgi:hypothetical protein
MFSIVEERWVNQGGNEQDKPLILKGQLYLDEWTVVAALQKILQQLQGQGIVGKHSASGGLDEYFPTVEILLDHFELAVQGVIIEENKARIWKRFSFWIIWDGDTRRLLKIILSLDGRR